MIPGRAHRRGLANSLFRSAGLGSPRDSLSDVVVTSHTDDMRPIYSRTRVLLALSLCWESGARVVAEAMINSIPAIITTQGGLPEMTQNAGIKVQFPSSCYEKPYMRVPEAEALAPVLNIILRLYDDRDLYNEYVARAHHVGCTLFNLETNVQRLTKALAPLIEKRAGDQDFEVQLKQVHKQRAAYSWAVGCDGS